MAAAAGVEVLRRALDATSLAAMETTEGEEGLEAMVAMGVREATVESWSLWLH